MGELTERLSHLQVRDGMIQQGNLINFGGQVKTHSYSGIEITLTNTSQGLYTLRDRKGRVVSITKMELTGEPVKVLSNCYNCSFILTGAEEL